MRILGIETSCDETAAAVVEIDDSGQLTLLSNTVKSSIDLHILYGGVVPEIAARSHIEFIMPVVEKALEEAFSPVIRSQESGIGEAIQTTENRSQAPLSDPWDQIDGIAVTYGPGLGGSLLVGVLTARTLAILNKKPLYAVNHVAAHAMAPFITKKSANPALQALTMPEATPQFPMLALIVSGGHSQLVIFRSIFDYTVLGRTRDDAIGEAFDKVAKVIGLPYPGGPSIEKASVDGDASAFKFPSAKLDNPYDFSFSGLKTAVLRTAQKEIGKDHTFPSFKIAENLSESTRNNIAASFQYQAIKTAVDNTMKAYEAFRPKSVIIAGGVAASGELRRQLADRLPIAPIYPPFKLCTDNGAMIAALGCMMARAGKETADPYTLDIFPNLSM